MTPNLTYVCDAPGCASNITIHPADAKDRPAVALERAGWQVTGAQGEPGEPTKVTHCLCPTHKSAGAVHVPVPTDE